MSRKSSIASSPIIATVVDQAEKVGKKIAKLTRKLSTTPAPTTQVPDTEEEELTQETEGQAGSEELMAFVARKEERDAEAKANRDPDQSERSQSERLARAQGVHTGDSDTDDSQSTVGRASASSTLFTDSDDPERKELTCREKKDARKAKKRQDAAGPSRQ
ncbi:hypothetical protein BJ508DRAFT_332848 [Ascobolus immersus RN42]|uniref:Uncharacterized protein n=1 Tax=Ascobolus immersus RN42 TaxID=1160509 RepID=A0A3N4HQC4_ASCIM|nr:hypothetical protein BJ508DRAFT_332848 [Ascobolus immersus RN42]